MSIRVSLRSVLLSLSMLVATPSFVSAQTLDEAPEPARASSPPAFRFDVVLPRFGVGHQARATGDDGVEMQLQAELRLVHVSGHGASIRGIGAFGPANMALVELDYLYRVQLTGDARLGVALDLAGGATAGHMGDERCFFGCTDGNVVDGPRLGGNAGLTLVFHAYGFTLDLDVRYRLTAPLVSGDAHETAEPEHGIGAALGIGFGFW